jgi:8-oxo-dGTP pyrophosphatase MutT (NUDIX family)
MTAPTKPADQDGPGAAQQPVDAATLIIVDGSSGEARFLMGKRRDDVAFMPGKYVFPGGRVDVCDRDCPSLDMLTASEEAKLLLDMKGDVDACRARALALAAVRETFEEAGLIIGGAGSATDTSAIGAAWLPFIETGYLPTLAPLTYFARAITPPGRPRRFDTRFFCCDISAVRHRVDSIDGELSGLDWFTSETARELDLPPITRVIIEDLGDRMRLGPIGPSDAAVPYYHQKHGTFRRELLTLVGAAHVA